MLKIRRVIDAICETLYPGSEPAALGSKLFVLAMLAAVIAVAVLAG